MNSLPPASHESAQTSALEWVRKRSGEIARFEPDKIARSIERAAQAVPMVLPSDRAAELVRMTRFFVESHATERIVPAAEVAEWVEKVLRETAHEDLARAYAGYGERKRWAGEWLPVVDERAGSGAAPQLWDKARLARSLRGGLNIDNVRAREIAGQVERALVAGRFTRLTTDLVREMVNNELVRWGISERLEPSGELRIAVAQLERQLADPGGPAATGRAIAGRIWREFALRQIVSGDVAEAVRRGLLRISGLEAPASLAAVCVESAALVRQSAGVQDFIARLGAELARAAESCSALIALDPVEPWLALLAGPDGSPAQLAERFWQELQSRLRHTGLVVVMNLCGGFLDAAQTPLGAGPLFGHAAPVPERRLAVALAGEILGRFQRDVPDWPALRLDWHWRRPSDPREPALGERALRLAAEGLPVSIAFPRRALPLGDGLRRSDDTARPVLDYIGISLPLVWRDAGSPRSWTALESGLARAAELAVRAAVQKREFGRRLRSTPDAGWIERCAVAVAPVGLDWTVCQLIGGERGFADDEDALGLAETLLRYLRDRLEREARFFALGVVLDGPPPSPHLSRADAALAARAGEDLAGFTPWLPVSGPRRQIHSAARLHAIAGAGTLNCQMALPASESHDKLEETIDWACQNTELVRLRLVPARPPAAQAVVAWPEP